MADRFTVGMLLLHPGTPRDDEAREQLAAAVPGGAKVGGADDTGIFEIELEARSEEEALQAVWDAVAASGTDDHIAFAEHPRLPEHWRHRSRSPQA